MTSSENERLKVRAKGGARLMSVGWVGVVTVFFGNERMEKRGPPRTSADEAEADAAALLEEFNDMLMEQPGARFLGVENKKGHADG